MLALQVMLSLTTSVWRRTPLTESLLALGFTSSTDQLSQQVWQSSRSSATLSHSAHSETFAVNKGCACDWAGLDHEPRCNRSDTWSGDLRFLDRPSLHPLHNPQVIPEGCLQAQMLLPGTPLLACLHPLDAAERQHTGRRYCKAHKYTHVTLHASLHAGVCDACNIDGPVSCCTYHHLSQGTHHLIRVATPLGFWPTAGGSAADLPPEGDEAEDAPSRVPGTLRGWQRRQLQNAVNEGRKKISVCP